MTRSTWGEPKASVMNIVNWEGMRGVSTGMITTPPRPCMNLLSQNPLFLVLNLPKEPLVEAGFESSIWHPVKPERHLKRVREQMDWATQKFSHTNAFDQSLKHTHTHVYIYIYDICMISMCVCVFHLISSVVSFLQHLSDSGHPKLMGAMHPTIFPWRVKRRS